METVFHTRSMISRAWSTFKTHWKFIIPAGIITMLLSGAGQVMPGYNNESVFVAVSLGIISFIVSTLVSIVIGLGWSQVLLKIIRTSKSDWNDFKTKPVLWGRYFLASLLYILFLIPFILLIVAGIILGIGAASTSNTVVTIIAIVVGIAGLMGVIWLAIRMMFLPFITIDHQDLKPKDLLKKSFNLTKGHVWTLIKLGFWQFLVFIAGLIALVIGLIIAIPVTYISNVYMYEHLKSLQKA